MLIDLPSSEMKALGLLTRTLHDSETGEKLAVVYVPTAPNPTSGYIEIVPLQSVVITDWTFDQAMSFVVTGGSTPLIRSDIGGFLTRTCLKSDLKEGACALGNSMNSW